MTAGAPALWGYQKEPVGPLMFITNQRLIVNSWDLLFACMLETQDFRPPAGQELTLSACGCQGMELCATSLVMKKVFNYSNAPD